MPWFNDILEALKKNQGTPQVHLDPIRVDINNYLIKGASIVNTQNHRRRVCLTTCEHHLGAVRWWVTFCSSRRRVEEPRYYLEAHHLVGLSLFRSVILEGDINCIAVEDCVAPTTPNNFLYYAENTLLLLMVAIIYYNQYSMTILLVFDGNK